MTLVKLDSGDYINTVYVEALMNMDDGWNAGMNHGETIKLTPADCYRIVEAMGGEYTENRKRANETLKEMADDGYWRRLSDD